MYAYMCECEWYLDTVFEVVSCFLFLNDTEKLHRVLFDVTFSFAFMEDLKAGPMTAAYSPRLTLRVRSRVVSTSFSTTHSLLEKR